MQTEADNCEMMVLEQSAAARGAMYEAVTRCMK